MKITIEAHGRTYSAELEDDIRAINQAVRGLLVAVGYHSNTVDEYFPNWEDYHQCSCSENEACSDCPKPHIETVDSGESITVNFTEDVQEYLKFKNETGRSYGI